MVTESGEAFGELGERPGALQVEDRGVGGEDSGTVEPERFLAEGLYEVGAVGKGPEAFDGVDNGGAGQVDGVAGLEEIEGSEGKGRLGRGDGRVDPELVDSGADLAAAEWGEAEMGDGIAPEFEAAAVGNDGRAAAAEVDAADVVGEERVASGAEGGDERRFAGAGLAAEDDGAAIDGDGGGVEDVFAALVEDGAQGRAGEEEGERGLRGCREEFIGDFAAGVHEEAGEGGDAKEDVGGGDFPVGAADVGAGEGFGDGQGGDMDIRFAEGGCAGAGREFDGRLDVEAADLCGEGNGSGLSGDHEYSFPMPRLADIARRLLVGGIGRWVDSRCRRDGRGRGGRGRRAMRGL